LKQSLPYSYVFNTLSLLVLIYTIGHMNTISRAVKQ